MHIQYYMNSEKPIVLTGLNIHTPAKINKITWKTITKSNKNNNIIYMHTDNIYINGKKAEETIAALPENEDLAYGIAKIQPVGYYMDYEEEHEAKELPKDTITLINVTIIHDPYIKYYQPLFHLLYNIIKSEFEQSKKLYYTNKLIAAITLPDKSYVILTTTPNLDDENMLISITRHINKPDVNIQENMCANGYHHAINKLIDRLTKTTY